MAARTAGFIALFVLMAGSATAKQEGAKAVVGDTVFVQLSGEVAKKYAEQTERRLPPGKDLGLTITMAATIEQLRADDKFRIECSSTIASHQNKPRLITLTAVVDPAKFKSKTTPANTPIYASPAAFQNGIKPTMTRTEQNNLHLELSDLHGVKLRTWSLVNEIGE